MDACLTANTNASDSRAESGIEGACSIGPGASLTINNVPKVETTTATIDVGNAQSQIDVALDGDDDNLATNQRPNGAKYTNSREFGDCHSPESLDADWCCINPERNLSLRQPIKTNEINTADERDRFSPVDFPAELLAAGANDDNAEDNNRLFRRASNDRGRLSSKEEKQRQNEEIVILESSSVSSETGSWESVFPQRHQTEAKELCKSFLNNEQKYCSPNSSQSRQESLEDGYGAHAERPPLAKKSSAADVPSPTSRPIDANTTPAKSACGACFIDASSLLDDEDAYLTSYTPQPILPAIACRGPKPDQLSPHSEKSKGSPEDDSDKDGWPKASHLDRLETFHRDFELCKMARSQPDSAIDLTNDDEQPDELVTHSVTHSGRILNLSDEQKLNKRDKEQIATYDIKDQYSSDSSSKDGPTVILPNANQVAVNDAQRDDRNDRNDRQQDQERKQGTFLFQNSIQQFSTHVMTPKFPYNDEQYSDLSLPSVYSGSSEPCNDCTSAFETSSQYSSNCGDAHDYGNEAASRYSKGMVSENEALLYPDTPHNSIIHVDAARNVRRDDSGMVSSSPPPESLSDHSQNTRRSLKGNEFVPILSGGASQKDFITKPCDSPTVRRKTETCPIISGGSVPDDFDIEPKSKYVERPRLSAAVNSWVVDMSNCNNRNRRRRSDSSSSSADAGGGRSTDTSIDRSGSGSSHKGLGFYVSLSDMKPPKLSEEVLSKSLNYRPSTGLAKKRSTGFYIDFSESEQSQTATPPPSKDTRTPLVVNGNDKKNMFSMFIDFGDDKKSSPNKSDSIEFSTSLPAVRGGLSFDSAVSSGGSVSTTVAHHSDRNENDQNRYMFIESESPVTLRRPQTVALTQSETKRHSWNTTKDDQPKANPREHKRSVSVAETTETGIMSILDKLPLISKTSSMSIDTPNSHYDDLASSKSISSCSNSLTSISVHSSIGANLPDVMNQSAKRRQRDAKINETFDKSSQGSLTDGILSKNSSPTTDTDDVTFQNDLDEQTRTSSGLMETIVETKETASPKKTATTADKAVTSKIEMPHTMESLQATIEKQKQLLDTVTEEVPMSTFVKLSDMDKPVQRFELHAEYMSKSMGSNRIGKLFDGGSRTGSRNSWHNMSRSTGNNLTNLASSADNLRSLSRIFPHLSKDLSNSSPADIEQDILQKSPNDMELFQSDFSITSSATSSFSRSGIDSADELSLSMSSRQPRRLGEDLLKMFLQEIATDVVIEVNGRRMRAHKCILRSRCQYFAAILAGGWVQSAGNVISLSGYSYGSVHFALCHIYSGASHPPDGISLMELAALADLLGLEGLKEVTAHALKTNYCHNFHKPCSGCIEGILQVFPVALNQGLDDLYRKCLRWACKHYIKVWPSRAFSQLPSDIIGRCRQHIIAHITSETVLSTLLDCDHLIALLASCRWAGGVENTVRDMIDAGHAYISDHFSNLVASDGFLSLGHGQSWNISRLEDILLRTAATLTPDQACRSYQRITRLNSVLGAKVIKMPAGNMGDNGFMDQFDIEHEEEMDWNPEFIRLVSALSSAVEQCLIRQCSRSMKTPQWQRMDSELRKKIQKLACLTEPVVSRPRSNPKPITYSPVTAHNSRTQDLYQVKLAIQAHSKRAQEGTYKPPPPPPQNNSNIYDRHVQTNERHQQPSHEARAPERNGTGKVSKSSSRAQVPDLLSTIKPKTPVATRPDRNLSLAHRRSQSETNNRASTKEKASNQPPELAATDKPRLTEIKSRYLEPKQRQRATALKNQTNLPLRQRNISSSDSSRTTSPVITTRRKELNLSANKKPTALESITMSRDSLSSPAKQNNRLIKAASGVSCNEYDQSIDSLGDSLRSSLKTDETKSQESLVHLEERRAKEALAKNPSQRASNANVNKENVMIIPANEKQSFATARKAVNKKLTITTKTLSTGQSNSTNSSPSSVTQKGRLSSASSVSSPRDSQPKLRQLIPGSAPAKPIARKSFLSARSKEILAKKDALKQSESAKSVPMVIREKINASVNKSSSTSNILSKRPMSIPTTTLHLRRTAKLSISSAASVTSNGSQNSLMNPTKSSSMKMVVQNNKMNKEKVEAKKVTKQTKIECDFYENGGGDQNSRANDDNIIIKPAGRIESKLERSSTFCKEVSDLPPNELQVIE